MNILVALDLSESSRTIIERVKSFVTDRASLKLWVLHVADPDPEFVGYEAGPQSVRDAMARKFHEEHAQLQQWAAELRAEQIDCTPLLIQGPYAGTILKQAEKLQADLIVVGSHGKSMARQLLMGSTSEAVMRRSHVPVLVVPTHERK